MTTEANATTDDAVALFRAGGTVAEVATLLGVDETEARRELRAGGVKRVPCRRVAQISLELIVLRHRWAHLLGVPVQYPPAMLYGFGADIDTIAELTGMNVEQVRSILVEDGEVYEPPVAAPSPQEQRAWRMVEARCEGRGLAGVGVEYGISSQRVHQITVAAAPWRPWTALRREAAAMVAEVREVRRAWMSARPCWVCGAPIGDVKPDRMTCSRSCQTMLMAVRYHLADGEHRRVQRLAVARWQIRNGHPTAHAKAVLEVDGRPLDPSRRGIIQGSRPWHTIRRALDDDLPLLEHLDPRVVDQVRSNR